MALPSFKITRDDGTSYTTSMAEHITLEMAREYFLGVVQTHEDFETGKETKCCVIDVQEIKTNEDHITHV